MPTEDEIRTLTLKATTDGVDEASAKLGQLADSTGAVADATDNSSKSSLSAASALDKQQRALDPVYRASQQLTATQKDLDRAHSQGLISLDRYNVLSAQAADRFHVLSTAGNAWSRDAGKISEVFGVMEARALGVASNFGIMGAALTVLGPVGIAAGAALGLLVVGMYEAKQAADALAQKALGLSQFSELTGISTTNLQALTSAAEQLGVGSDRTRTFVERFTVSFEALKTGSGPLFTALAKIDPELVRQMGTAKDTTTAFNLLAQAYASATTESQKAALARAAGGGKGGSGDAGLVLGSVASSGGLDRAAASMDTFGVLTSDEIQRWAKMDTQIAATLRRAKDGMASIFTDTVKQEELVFAQGMERIAIEAERISKLTPAQAWTEWFVNMGKYLAAEGGGVSSGFDAPKPIANIISPPAYPPQLNTAGLASPAAAQNNAVDLNLLKEKIAALGSVATASEHLQEKELTLAAAYDAGKIGVKGSAEALGILARARAGLNTESEIQTEAKRLSVLGQEAPLTEILAQKKREINLLRAQGITISASEEAGIRATLIAQRASSDTAILTANNVVTAEGLRATKLAELNALLANHKLTQDQVNVSASAYQKIIEQTIQQQEVLKAQLPGLKQLQLTSSDLRTSLDTLGTSVSSGLSTEIVNLMTNTNNASTAFKNMGLVIVKALDEMVVKMLFTAPIAKGLGSILSSFLGTSGGTSTASSDPLGLNIGSANGNVFQNGRLMAFASGGIFNSPTLFPMANGGTGLMGEAGPEAVMPLTRTSDGKLGVKNSGGAQSGGDVHVHFAIDARGAERSSADDIIARAKAEILPRVVPMVIDAKSRGSRGLK